MMKLWETFAKHCCGRPAAGLCVFQAELTDDSQIQKKKKKKDLLMHACAHTHTHDFIINLTVTIQHMGWG